MPGVLMSTSTWSEVRSLCEEKDDLKSKAVWLWLQPVKGVIPLNDAGFPIGRPLRWVARELEKLGYRNGKGGVIHPYQLQQEIIFPHVADLFIQRSHGAVLEALKEGCRQKVTYLREDQE